MAVKKDCILYKKESGVCKGLRALYCRKEECAFYKSKRYYNSDGTKKPDNGQIVIPDGFGKES